MGTVAVPASTLDAVFLAGCPTGTNSFQKQTTLGYMAAYSACFSLLYLAFSFLRFRAVTVMIKLRE